MDWTPGGISSDIEDRRDDSGGGGGFGFGGIHLGCGGFLLLAILSLLFHRNLFTLFGGGPGSATVSNTPRAHVQQSPGEQREVQFVSFVLDDVQKNWTIILPQQAHRQYRHAHLVLFRDEYPSGCGMAETPIGPFYCPEDEKVYLDLGFFDELRRKLGAPGEFAQAYVIAHELGHHVQKILGIEPRVQRLRQENPEESNVLSVRLELQADCYAGIWAHTTEQRNIVHEADIASAINAAAAVGDDRLQRMSTGHVSPEKFTHGTSQQRVTWFRRGLETGELAGCDTFRRKPAR